MSSKMRIRVRSSVEGLGVVAAGRAHATFTGVTGWEDWKIELDLAVVNGRVEVRGIVSITPEDPSLDLNLTTRKLATLPLQALADVAMKGMDFTLQPDLQNDIRRIREADVEGASDRRTGLSLKEFATAYLAAYYDPNVSNVNEAVAKRVDLKVRMVAYKLKEARAIGLIPSDLPTRRSRRPPSQPS